MNDRKRGSSPLDGGAHSPREMVTAGTFTMVERCECGTVYLTVGPVCLRLCPGGLPELQQVILRAIELLGISAATAATAAPEEGSPCGSN